MELEQLRIFISVAETGSFTKGAKRLYISHSTTSRAIAALEEELGARLFERSNHISALTPAGKVLLEEAGKLIASFDGLKDRILSEKAELER